MGSWGGYGGNHHIGSGPPFLAEIFHPIPGAAGKLLRAGCSRGWETRHVSDHYHVMSYLDHHPSSSIVRITPPFTKAIKNWPFGSGPKKTRCLGELQITMVINLHPRNLTWNLKISPRKRKVHLETIILRFHVKFRGCNWDDPI